MDYGFSKELEEDDERQELWEKQRMERGFDDTETWNLDITLAKFMIPRLKRFKETTNGYPTNLTSEEWDEKIDKIILFFDIVAKDSFPIIDKNKKEYDEGKQLFFDYFEDLWW